MLSTVSLNQVGCGNSKSETGFATFIGFILGCPVAVPTPPMYVLAFLALLLAAGRSHVPLSRGGLFRGALVILLIFLAILSNLIGLFYRNIDSLRIFYTSFFFILFFFSGCIADKRALLRGFCAAMMIWAVLIIVMAGVMHVFDNGILLFVVPEFRLWGAGIFPDWPNYMAFMLALAFMLNATLFGRPVQAVVLLIAALLTTSRTPLIAVVLLMFAKMALYFKRPRLKYAIPTVVIVILVLVGLVSMMGAIKLDQDFVERMLVFEDRDEIYSFAINLVRQSPWVGYGSILLDGSVGFTGHPSFHNSYLDVVVRHGVPALLVFILLLVPPRRSFCVGGIYFASILLFFLLGSIFQNFLKHPHIMMLYVVFIDAGDLFHANLRQS